MSRIARRDFMAVAAGTATCLASAVGAEGAIPSSNPPPPPRVPLGKTGLHTSRLALGTGTHGWKRQSDQTRTGFEQLVGLFRHAFDRGIRLFDLADLYGSHVYFREALRHIPRDQVTLLTKLWWRYNGPLEKGQAASQKQMAATAIERFCHEIGTDHLDIVLLHCMQTADWDQQLASYMDALAQAKKRGQIRAVGVSCHDLGALKTAAKCPWVDVVLARINPKGVKMDGTPEEVTDVLRQLQAAGKAVIGMKIFGEGKLVDQRVSCMQFAQNLGLLDAMTIGFDTPAQIDEALTLMDKFPAKPVG